jgi:hypothetical protein
MNKNVQPSMTYKDMVRQVFRDFRITGEIYIGIPIIKLKDDWFVRMWPYASFARRQDARAYVNKEYQRRAELQR